MQIKCITRSVLENWIVPLAALMFLIAGCGGGTSTTGSPSATLKAVSGSSAVTSDYYPAVQQLYIAYFGRPADPSGLVNFAAALVAAGAPTDIQGLNAAYGTNATVRALIDNFGTSEESKTLYGSDTNAFVTAVYQGLFNRATDAGGFAFWVGAINSGTLTKGNAAISIMAGALANTTTQGKADAAAVNNKVIAANYFTNTVSTFAYQGNTAAASVRSMLGKVSDTTDTTVFQGTINNTIAGLASAIWFAGPYTGVASSVDGPAATAKFNGPSSVAIDAAGNIYVAEASNTIRKISFAGVVSTIAGTAGISGSTDGTGAAARFDLSTYSKLAVDAAGNLYVCDTYNHTIRKITPSGMVTTLAGSAGIAGSANGLGAAARFSTPIGLTVDKAGNVYVADTVNSTIRMITPNGLVTTLAGSPGLTGANDGNGSAARFNFPYAIAVDSVGNVFIADAANYTIRKITANGSVTTLAGTAGIKGSSDASGISAKFNFSSGIAIDSASIVYVTDSNSSTIRSITPFGQVVTIAGTVGGNSQVDGFGTGAVFSYPHDLTLDSSGNIYVADFGNNAIRKFNTQKLASTVAGGDYTSGSTDGISSAARFNFPFGLAVDSSRNVYVADTNNHTVRKITQAGSVTTLAGSAGDIGTTDGLGGAARFNVPHGVAVDSAGNSYVADARNHIIRKISPFGMTSTLAGLAGVSGNTDGVGSVARFNYPSGLAVDAIGNVFVADTSNQTIRKITPAGVVTTLAGSPGTTGSTDGLGSAARFYNPLGVILDSIGNVYVPDYSNSIVRKITPAGLVTTFAGSPGVKGSANGQGASASFSNPIGVALDNENNVYVADDGNDTIRKITPNGMVTTVVGRPGSGGLVIDNEGGYLPFPKGIAIDNNNVMYVSTLNNIFKIQLP